MKRLVFEKILILSYREKRAIEIIFDQKRTIIRGDNQVGKSTLLKSLYYTFGANPSVLNDTWTKAEPITYVRFRVDDLQLGLMRYDKKKFVLVDENDNVTSHDFSSISSKLNEYFDFKFLLNNRSGTPEIPPPVYLFLPFYIDQDKSWYETWNAFSNLYQFTKWKKPLLDYHSGIKGNEYYKTKSDFDNIKVQLDETKNEIFTLSKILKSIKEKLSSEEFSMTIEDFSNEIAELLAYSEELNIEQIKLKDKLADLYNQKSIVTSRVRVVENSINETQKDYKFALNHVHDEIDCPMCGAQYDNNFSERFSIAEDEEELEQLLIELKTALNKVNEEIKVYDKTFIEKKINFEKMQEILNQKKSDIKLSDLIENEGKKKVKEIFQQEQNSIYTKIGEATSKYDSLEDKLKRINKDGESKKQSIMTKYRSGLRKFLLDLNIDVEKTSKGIFERMDSKIKEQGSNLPRAHLAYYFSILHVMNQYSTSTYFPIVIDSPNQQEQDKDNLRAILSFIEKNQPSDSQLILGLVENIDNTVRGSEIILPEKYSLLQKTQFNDVYNELRPILDASVFNDDLFPPF